jgi:hypothetical protein
VNSDEEKAAHDSFAGTLLEDINEDVLSEYEMRQTIEAKIVKDADNLDIDVELKEFEERGSQLPDWHIQANKWLRIPEAGK